MYMFNLRAFAFLLLSGFLFLSACSNDKNRQDSSAENNAKPQNNTPETISSQQVLSASLEGKINLIEEAVEQGVDITGTDQSGRTPLMLASFNGHTDITKLLLENGADPEKTDNQGQAALSFAASGPYPQTVELLLENGADPNHTDDSEGWSALMWAAAEGNEEVVKVLLDHDADPDLRDKDEDTARDFAEDNGHQKIAEILKQAESSN